MSELQRNAYFDNARLLFISLVVFGHLIQPFVSGSTPIASLYTWIYTFHMPAFIMIAGYFAKGSKDPSYIATLAKKLLIPYVIFQIIYTIYYFLIDKKGWLVDSIFYPHWSLWFLFSLFSWHLLLILYRKIPAFAGIALALLLGVIIGYFDQVGHMFSLSRTFVFFPYFLIGYWLSERHINLLKQKKLQISAVLILISTATLIYYLPHINSGWLLASKSYSSLGVEYAGSIYRLSVYLTSLLIAFSVLALVPRRRFSFTVLGERTLYVYLLHGFIVQYFRQGDILQANNLLEFSGIVLLSVVIVVLLSSKFMMTITEPIIEVSSKGWQELLDKRRLES